MDHSDFLDAPASTGPVQTGPHDAFLDSTPDEKSISGFIQNAGSDIGNIASGVGSLAKGLVTHPIDTTTNLVKNIVPATYNEYKDAITHPIEHTYAHPVNTLLDALPLASGAMKIGQATGLLGDVAEGTEAASTASKAAEEVSSLSQGASEMGAAPLTEGSPRASALVPGESSSLPGSMTPRDAFVKAQNDYDINIAKVNEMREQAENAGKLEEFERTIQDHPAYKAAVDASKASQSSASDLLKSGMTSRDIDNLRFEEPNIPTIAKAKPQTISYPAVTPADRVANSAFIQGMGSTPRKVLSEIGMGSGKNLEQKVSALRNWASTADNGNNVARLSDKAGEFSERLWDIHDTAGKTMGDILSNVGKESSAGLPAIDKEAVIKDLQDFADNTADPATEASINKLIKTAGKMEGKPLTDLKIVQQIKQMVGSQLKKDPNLAPIYGHLSEKINNVIEEYGNAVNDPAMKTAYDKAKLNYANTSKLLPILALDQAKGMVMPHGVIRNIAEKMFQLSTGNTPGQLYKNALLKGANKVGTIGSIGSKTTAGLPAAAYAGLENELTRKYGRNQ